MGWCDDPNSKQYNQLVKLPSSFTVMKNFIKENIYDIVLVLNYNMNPTKKNKGSAIFIHIAKRNYKKTEGCVAIKKIQLLKLLKFLKAEQQLRSATKNRRSNSYKVRTLFNSFHIISGHSHTKIF